MPPSHGVQDVISADRLFPVSTSEREDGHLASLVSGESDMVVAFLCSSDITFIPHQLAFQNVTQSVLDKTRTVDISDGHVSTATLLFQSFAFISSFFCTKLQGGKRFEFCAVGID